MEPGRKSGLRELSDEDLVSRCMVGDLDAFGSIVERYIDPVRALAYSYTRSVADAEDIAQGTFLAAFSNLNKLRNPSKLSGWLGRIASNLCIDWLHARNREVPLDGTQLSGIGSEGLSGHPTETPMEKMTAAEQRERVVDSINGLPSDYRVVVLLRYWNNMRYDSIAALLSLPLSTVKGRLYKAKQMLRERLKWYVEESERIEH